MSDAVETTVGHITWHELLTADKERQQRFYGELLGWEFEQFKPGEFDYPMIKNGGGFHGGLLQLEQEAAPTHWIAYVETTDAAGVAERVEAGGGSVIVEPRPIADVGTFTMLADPQGAVIAAIEPVDQGPLPRGTFVWDELLTDDIEAAKRFYGDIFGWTAEDAQMEGGPPYTVFKLGDRNIAGGMTKPERDLPSVWQTYLGTDDVDAATRRAAELGATVIHEPMSVANVGRFSVCADPLGAVFGLFMDE